MTSSLNSVTRLLHIIQHCPSIKENDPTLSLVASREVNPQTTHPFSGYYKKTIFQRQKILINELQHLLSFANQATNNDNINAGNETNDQPLNLSLTFSLPMQRANEMIENCIGVLGIPLGICPYLLMNNKRYIVPMATEEPSVIAAVSSICKLIALKTDGFHTKYTGNLMIGQIQILIDDEIGDDIHRKQLLLEKIHSIVIKKSQEWIAFGNKNFCSSMHRRGGGILKIEPIIIQSLYVVIHIHINVCNSMGANLINTVCEHFGVLLDSEFNHILLQKSMIEQKRIRIGLKILSNLCLERMASARFEIAFKDLGWKGMDGETVAKRIIEANAFAMTNEYRACTHNKGIMNGIDSVCIALGEDFRAIEAGVHCYAALKARTATNSSSYYSALTDYQMSDQSFVGSLQLPISVANKLGSNTIRNHRGYQLCHEILNADTSDEIAQVVVCIGLAQNFAALRALSIEGIQKGHMQLHDRKQKLTNF